MGTFFTITLLEIVLKSGKVSQWLDKPMNSKTTIFHNDIKSGIAKVDHIHLFISHKKIKQEKETEGHNQLTRSTHYVNGV